jgi:hypothetical protein
MTADEITLMQVPGLGRTKRDGSERSSLEVDFVGSPRSFSIVTGSPQTSGRIG